MAQSGYTPISIYYSATASNTPTAGNLVAGELAINTADGKLFYKDSAGVVQVIAGKGGAGVAGGSNTQVQYNSSGSLAGSANFTWDNANIRLGIGTASPSYSLDVINAAGSTLRLQSSTTNAGASLILDAATGTGANQITFLRNSANKWAMGGGNVGLGGTNDFVIYSYTNSINALTILDSNANVGIGTASPTAKAQIGDGTVVATNRLVLGKAQTASEGNLPAIGQQSAGVGNDLALAGTSVSAAIRFYTGASTNSGEIGTGSNAERMRIDSSGNVLINTTSATSYFSNYNKSGLLSGQTGASQVNGAYSFTNYSAASNNSTVDVLRFVQPSGQQMSGGFLTGILSIYVSGGSGANAYSENYTLTSCGNGTTSATLTGLAGSSQRGTNPISTIQVANDGGGGAIKITITYINNSGVVNGGYCIASFTGIVSPT